MVGLYWQRELGRKQYDYYVDPGLARTPPRLSKAGNKGIDPCTKYAREIPNLGSTQS